MLLAPPRMRLLRSGRDPKYQRIIRKLQRAPKRNKKMDKILTDAEDIGCFFCGAVGHKKKHCQNYHAWRVKKDMFLNLICSEVNLTFVSKYIW